MITFRTLVLLLALLQIFATTGHAARYYVKPDGNDDLDGRSDATAWKSISKVNGYNFDTGDDVYFKTGGLYNILSSENRLDVDWSGTGSNQVTIGAYYMSDGYEVIGVNDDGKPIIDGQGSYPKSIYSGLVHADGNYITIDNLQLQGSGGYGVAAYSCANIDIANCHLFDIYSGAILFKSSSDCSAVSNFIRNAGLIYNKAGGNQETRPGTIQVHTSSNNLISKNKIIESWGEGIGIYHGSNYNDITFNQLYSVWAAGIYIDASHHNNVTYNLIYGRGDQAFAREEVDGTSFTGPGIWVDDEPGHITSTNYQSHNIILGNIVAFCSDGLIIATSDPASVFKDSKVYNNTFVDNSVGIRIYGGPFSNSEIANNVIWQPSGDPDYLGQSATSGITWSNNSWTSTVAAPDTSLDSIAGDPELAKSAGWRSGDLLYAQDFAIGDTSPLSDAGKSLAPLYATILDLDQSSFDLSTFHLVEYQSSDTETWDIGADTDNASPASELPLEPSAPILSIVSE
jgi:hypothetical protein